MAVLGPLRQFVRLFRRNTQSVDWGDFRRTKPVSKIFGLDRGTPVDRYYIEQFLRHYSSDIRGRCIEFGDGHYTKKFGGKAVTISEILDVSPDNAKATVVCDISKASELPSDVYSCILCIQTLPFIYELTASIETLHRFLAPGGVLLCSLSGISQVSRFDMDRWGDYWRFTTKSAHCLFEPYFGDANIAVNSYGNALAATAFLQGISAEELTQEELDIQDPDYQVTITVRAVKNAN